MAKYPPLRRAEPVLGPADGRTRGGATSPPLSWVRGKEPCLAAGASSPPSSGGEVVSEADRSGGRTSYPIASPLWGGIKGGGTAPRLPERPIRLFASPEPVEAVAAEVPEGAPASFRWRRVFHHVAASEGPERIAPEWWRGDGSEETRNYFRIEDEEGRRYWLYRQGFYGEGPQVPRWFMHGIFA